MVEEENALITIDLAQSKLHLNIKDKIRLSLHFNSKSRRFYLSVIALVLHEMKKSGQTTSIPLEKHYDTLALLNETVGGKAGSSDREKLLPRIYRKWRNALPDLENSPLFRVLGKKKEYDAIGKTYQFTDKEKDAWANLFDYKGSEEKVRLRFSIDKLGVTLDDVLVMYDDVANISDENGWDGFLKSLTESPEKQTITRQISAEPVGHATAQAYPHRESPALDLPKAEEEKLSLIQRYLPAGLADKIIAQRGNIEGERKQVTVMYCKVKDYTSLFEGLDPEEIYSIMNEVFEILINKVHDNGGTVNEMSSDGIMALFGAPIARENAPQGAIRSALAIHREMVKFGKGSVHSSLSTLKMRIGIHSGPVVVGTIGNDLRVEFKAVGDTVNLASRMEELAEPGTTYVTQGTYKLTEGLFRFEAMGERAIKGNEEPVSTYRVIAPSGRRTRFDVNAERGLTTFIGREKELELLLEGFQRASGSSGQAFSIVSEAGVGKSRLLYEFRKAVANEDATFLEGRCLSYSSDVPYHPVIDLLKSNFDIHDSDDDLEIKEKVTKGLQVINADDHSTLPSLLELLQIEDSGMDMSAMSPEVKKKRILDALKQIVLKGSEMRPLIMAVEDVQWIDPSSKEAFKEMLESISGASVLLIFTYRPEFVHIWGGRSYYSQVNLNRLNKSESLAMVTYLLGTDDIDSNLIELVFDKTEGVPFFIEELIKSLEELKIIENKDGRYFLTKDSVDVAIPCTVQDVIMARVDSLTDEAKGILQTGSVMGREFGYDLIKRVTGLPEQNLLSHLFSLKQTELLYERGIFPQSSYIFRHALTQNVVYESILSKRKKELHAETGEAIEELYTDRLEEFYEILANHYAEANLVEQAIGYWQQAGERAVQRSAYMEAISHLTRGLELLKTLPEAPKLRQQELVFQTSLGWALARTKGYASPDVKRAFTRAQELCRQVKETHHLFPILQGLRLFFMVRGELQTARKLGEKLLTAAQRVQDPALLMEAHRALGVILLHLGELTRARAHQEQGIALYDPQQHRSHAILYGGDPKVVFLSYAAITWWQLGYPDQALNKSQEALYFAQELSHAFSLAFALTFIAQVHQLRREVQAVQTRDEALIKLSTEHGIAQWLPLTTCRQVWTLSELGHVEKGISLMHRSLDSWRATGAELGRPSLLSLLAEAYGGMRQAEEGLTLLAEALVLVDKTGERQIEAELHRIKGELLLAQSEGNQAEAEESYHKALEVSRAQQAKSFELRAAVSLSRLWQSQGKREEARDLLTPVYDWFTEGFDTADLKDAKALLEELA